MTTDGTAKRHEPTWLLSDLIGTKAFVAGKAIGRLSDLVIVERGPVPEVTHLVIARPFGNPRLLVPWERVSAFGDREIALDLTDLGPYQHDPPEGSVLLKDHILDKKVLDIDGKEVEVIYDLGLVEQNRRLFVAGVDLSRYGMLKRMGLRPLARFVCGPEDELKRQVSWAYVQHLPSRIGAFKGNVTLNILKEKLSDIHPVDLADILEELDHEQRMVVFRQLDPSHASDTLEEINPNVQREVISSLETPTVAKLINEMTPGQGADVLGILPQADASAIVALLSPDKAAKVRAILERHEEQVIHFVTPNFIKVPPDMTVGQVQNDYPRIAKNKDVVMYLYVVNKLDILLGVLDIKEVLEADDNARLQDIMIERVVSLRPESTLREAAELFARYDLRALPVTDRLDRIVGVVPFRDVMRLTHPFAE